MNSQTTNEIGADDSDGHILKILEAVAMALEELDLLRAARPMTPEVLDAEVARIAQERLHPHGCDLVVQHQGADSTRLSISMRPVEIGTDLVRLLLHQDDESNLEAKA